MEWYTSIFSSTVELNCLSHVYLWRNIFHRMLMLQKHARLNFLPSFRVAIGMKMTCVCDFWPPITCSVMASEYCRNKLIKLLYNPTIFICLQISNSKVRRKIGVSHIITGNGNAALLTWLALIKNRERSYLKPSHVSSTSSLTIF